MKLTTLSCCAFVFCALSILSQAANAQGTQTPERLKRAESFFGIHFDFHAGPDCTEVGKNTTPEMINTIIDLVKPDYVQTDCKGHAGYTSYPTKVGNQVPGYVGDPLRVWRDVTAARGVGLYMHYSGVWDSRAIELNPDWAAIDGAGNRNPNNTSVFGPYIDKLFIPQLKELAGDYQVDGIWVDGECWATMADYGERAQKLFRETTGIDTIPRGPGDAHWFEWMQFHREAFRSYMRHYTASVRSAYPDFQICSNWAFTDHMPEPVSVAVDFLSGDYSPNDSVNSARYSGRFLVHQGVPWDLMAWSFSYPSPRQQKTAVQLKREAAVVLALGGGFQAYFTQNRDGSVRLGEMDVMAEVAKFARERQPYCHRSIQIPQVAVLYSVDAYQRNAPGLFARYGDNEKLRGVLQCLLELQYSV
ncbi:MAG: alpha-L-fucosidase, partial [Planctomycetaceae bacterium]|nr:alpha-L-fucosidase [Planctomycetaceae bacterium]